MIHNNKSVERITGFEKDKSEIILNFNYFEIKDIESYYLKNNFIPDKKIMANIVKYLYNGKIKQTSKIFLIENLTILEPDSKELEQIFIDTYKELKLKKNKDVLLIKNSVYNENKCLKSLFNDSYAHLFPMFKVFKI